MANSFDRKLKRLAEKDWSVIADNWTEYLPFIDPAGSAPEQDIADLPGLMDVLKALPKDGELRVPFANVRPLLVHNAAFLTHKAVHVACAAERNITQGMPTWALVTSYRSAVFSQRALLALLGVATVQINGSHVLLDAWPGHRKGERKQRKMEIDPSEVQFVRLPSRPDHAEHWKVLQRLARVTDSDQWDPWFTSFIDSVNPREFARQRNVVHYFANRWLYGDLFESQFIDGFDECGFSDSEEYPRFEEESNFSIQMAFLLLRNVIKMLSALASAAPILEGETRLIRESLEKRGNGFLAHWYPNVNGD